VGHGGPLYIEEEEEVPIYSDRPPNEARSLNEDFTRTGSDTIYKTPFMQIVDEIVAMHDKKQKDYGTNADPLANVRASADFGIEPWIGVLIRMNDKMKRLQKAARGGQLANESVEDSILDIAVYAIIDLVLYRETQQPKAAKYESC
jgi:hypothetical protein